MFLSFNTLLLQLFSAVPTARYGVALPVLLIDLTSPITVFPEGDIIVPLNEAGRQAWMSLTNSILPNVGPVPVETHPRPVLPGTQLVYNTLSILALPYLCKPATY